ncbi:hypothetical protein B566_EDAN009318 [Ephemera danica]|nr:hypothetical protein B566_EDAN009318 [Ephemera danica]
MKNCQTDETKLTSTAIALLLDFRELAGNVSRVTIQHSTGTIFNKLIKIKYLSGEVSSSLGWVVLRVSADVATAQLLDGHILDIEANIVSGHSLLLNFSGEVDRGEGDNHARFHHTSLHTAHGHRSNTTDLVYVLQGETQGLLGRSAGRKDGIKGLNQALAISIAFLALNLPSLEPGHLVRGLEHVVSVPAGDGNKSDGGGVVTNLLDLAYSSTDEFKINVHAHLTVRGFSRVHLVDTNNQLLHTKSECKQSMLTSLSVLGDTSFKFTSTSSNDQHSAVSL